jgi:hypothetical protein
VEPELIGDVRASVTVIVDVNLIEDVIPELVEIRPPAGDSSGT